MALCAAAIKGQRELRNNFDLYSQGIKELISKPPSAEVIRLEWDLVRNNDAWSLNKGLDPEAVVFMSNVIVKSGLLKAQISPDEILDLRPSQAALKLLGPYTPPTGEATAAATMQQ
jgi:hypothetical protein